MTDTISETVNNFIKSVPKTGASEVLQIISDFILVWRFVYSSIIGTHHVLTYFYSDPAKQNAVPVVGRSKINGENCPCSNCKYKFTYRPVSSEICDVIKTLKYLDSKDLQVTIVHLCEFLFGNSTKWNKSALETTTRTQKTSHMLTPSSFNDGKSESSGNIKQPHR